MPQLLINKKVEKFKTFADALESKIQYYLKPAIASQRSTRRRANIAASMQSEGLRLQQIQGWLYGLSAAIAQGQLPPVLEAIANRTQLELLQQLLNSDLADIFDVERDYDDEFRQKLTAIGLTTPDLVKMAILALQSFNVKLSVDPTLLKIQELERSLIGLQMPGFFPTPEKLAQRLVQEAGIREGSKILEPSAGLGHLAIAARDVGGVVDCIEIYPDFVEILQLKGFSVRRADFLSLTPEPIYQAVILNSPYEKGQDCLHIRHAFEWLTDGGRLVALASKAVTYNSREPYASFRDWLEDVGGTIKPLPDNAFLTSFRPTAVKTILIVVER